MSPAQIEGQLMVIMALDEQDQRREQKHSFYKNALAATMSALLLLYTIQSNTRDVYTFQIVKLNDDFTIIIWKMISIKYV